MSDAARWGKIGGLTAWSRNDAATMVGPAHRGFRARFERLVDPDGVLDEAERSARADRARRAHMLTLAARSAEARRRKAGPDRDSGPASVGEGNGNAPIPTT
jgi:hypothetical protein